MRRATEANAVGLLSFHLAPIRGRGRGPGVPVETTRPPAELRNLDRAEPTAQTRLVNEPRSGVSVTGFDVSHDGRYVAYQGLRVRAGIVDRAVRCRGRGLWHEAQLAFRRATGAAQAQFNDAGTFVYYDGCAPATTTIQCTVHRASVVSRVVERVAPAQPDVSATLLTPVTRDDDRIVFQNVITHNNAPWEFPLMMSRAGQPDVATPLGGMAVGETSNFPLGLFADGSRVFMSIASPTLPLRSVVASLTQPDDVITLGGPGLWDGDIYLPRALRADSGAVLYRRCDGGSCQVYETRLDDRAPA